MIPQAKLVADPEAGATLDKDGFVVPQPGSVPNPGAHLRPEQNSQPSPDTQPVPMPQPDTQAAPVPQPRPDTESVPVPQPNDTVPVVAPVPAPVSPAAQPITSSSALLNALTGTGPAPADIQAGTQALKQAARTTPDPNAALLGALTQVQVDATTTAAIPPVPQGVTPPASAGSNTRGGSSSAVLLNSLLGLGPATADIQAGSQAIQQAGQNSSDPTAAVVGVLTNTQIQQHTTSTADTATTVTSITGPDGHTRTSIMQRPVLAPSSSLRTQDPVDPKAQATRDWVSEMWQLGLRASRFQNNLTGGGGWSEFTHSWSTLARGVTSFGQTWSSPNPQLRADALTNLGSGVIRWDDLKEHGPEYWQTKIGLDLGAGIALDGPTAAVLRGGSAAATATEKAAIQAGKDVGQAVDHPTAVIKSEAPTPPIDDNLPAPDLSVLPTFELEGPPIPGSGTPHPGFDQPFDPNTLPKFDDLKLSPSQVGDGGNYPSASALREADPIAQTGSNELSSWEQPNNPPRPIDRGGSWDQKVRDGLKGTAVKADDVETVLDVLAVHPAGQEIAEAIASNRFRELANFSQVIASIRKNADAFIAGTAKPGEVMIPGALEQIRLADRLLDKGFTDLSFEIKKEYEIKPGIFTEEHTDLDVMARDFAGNVHGWQFKVAESTSPKNVVGKIFKGQRQLIESYADYQTFVVDAPVPLQDLAPYLERLERNFLDNHVQVIIRTPDGIVFIPSNGKFMPEGEL